MGKHTFRFGYPTVPHSSGKRAAAAAAEASGPDGGDAIAKRQECNLYLEPTENQDVEVETPTTFKWDPTCWEPAANSVTLELINESTGNATWGWGNVRWDLGTLQKTITPTMIKDQESMDLRVTFKDSTVPWMPVVHQGPLFTAKWDSQKAAAASIASVVAASSASAAGVQPTEQSRFEWVNNFFSGGLSKGQIAAAVIMPILAVAGFLIAYVLFARRKENAKRKEWKEKMDQRMSTISVDWKSMSAAGGAAAVRYSMAEKRASSFYGGGRPSSNFGDNNPAARARDPATLTHGGSRLSKVSFAADSYHRPSVDHLPAVPKLPAAYQRQSTFNRESILENDNQILSPTQQQGAFVLDDDNIRDRLGANGGRDTRPSMDEELNRDLSYEPAIAMMRQAGKSTDDLNRVHATRPSEVIFDEPMTPITPLNPVVTREAATGPYRTYSIGAYSGSSDASYFDQTAAGVTAPSSSNNLGGSVSSQVTAPPAIADPDAALRAYAARSAVVQQPRPTASPFAGFASGPGLAAAAGLDMSSPDAIFRAYAATRPITPAVQTVGAQVMPLQTTGGAMRTLYGANGGMAQGLAGAAVGVPDVPNSSAQRGRSGTVTNNPYRDSMATGDGNPGYAS